MDRDTGSARASRRRAGRTWTGRLESLEARQLLAIDVTSYPLPMIERSIPTSITQGPDGNLWFTESNSSKVTKAGTDGQILQEFDLGIPTGTSLASIITGPDNALYFTELGHDAQFNAVAKIARLTTTGQLTEFPVEANATVAAIARGSDGNIWFTENVSMEGGSGPRIGRMTPDGQIATFAVPGSGGYFGSIVAAPDGNLWFSDSGNGSPTLPSKIGKISTGGVATEYTLPNSRAYVSAMTVGPDGNVWFGETTYDPTPVTSIGKIAPDGTITEFAVPADAITYSGQIVALSPGSDGNVWFAQPDRVGKITPTGQISTVAVPSTSVINTISAMTLGPDGNSWYLSTNYETAKLGRVNPALQVEEFSIPPSFTTDPSIGISVAPNNIVKGSDGSLWFSTLSNSMIQIRKMATDGTVTVYDVNSSADGSYLTGLTRGPDGNVWFSISNSNSTGGSVGKITPTGTVTRFDTPGSTMPLGITAGPDGNLWSVGTTNSKGTLLKITTAGTIKSRALSNGFLPSGPMLSGPAGKLWVAGTRQTKGKRASVVGVVAVVNLNTGGAVQHTLPRAKGGGNPIPLAAAATVRSPNSGSNSSGSTSTDPNTAALAKVASPTSPIDSKIAAPPVGSTVPIYSQAYYSAQSMTVGPEGNVWIAASSGGNSRVIRMTPGGKMTSFDVPEGLQASSITVGTDGNLWFSANRYYYYPFDLQLPMPPVSTTPSKVGRITPGGVVTLFNLPDGLTNVSSITSGPDGKLWLTDANDSRVAKFSAPSLFGGSLAASDHAGLATNATKDSRPTFEGVAHPYAHVSLFAKSANDSTTPIGSAKADSTGRWTIHTKKALMDGSYQVYGGETDAGGFYSSAPEPLSPFSADGPLVIDTTSPRISAFGYDAASRQVSITVGDTGSGFAIPTDLSNWIPVLSDPSLYRVTPANSTAPLGFNVSMASGSTNGQATVILTLNQPVYGSGDIKVKVDAKRLMDQAGNLLDGEFRGKLPSGNGRAGGDFVAILKAKQARA